MVTSLLIAGCLLLGQPEAPAAEDPAAAALARRVRLLVHQLDAPRLAERDEAEAELAKLGPAVLDLLPAPDDGMSADVKHRLAAVRQTLELQVAEQTAQASKVTLQAQQMPIAEVLAAIAKQTGNKIELSDEVPAEMRQKKIDVAFAQRPFWEAFDKVLDMGPLTTYPYGEQAALYVVPRSDGHTPRCEGAFYSGPIRFVALRAIARRELRESLGDGLQVTLEAAWEPRVTPIFLKQKMEKVEATDERGNRMEVESSGAEFEIGVNTGQTASEVNVPLALPSRDVKAIGTLKGSLTALLPGRVETFRFSDLTKAEKVQQRKGGVTVVLERARKENEAAWEIRMLVRFDEAGQALESHRGWIMANEAYLEDDKGQRVEVGGLETTRRTDTEAGVAYYFAPDRPIEAYTFVYRTPCLLTTKDFPYEVKDIKLP